jgi:peptidoglycan/LPS O-acetylase OafA/YrhL
VSKYRPEIDGLRALAVCAVILYHSKIEIFSSEIFKGGFIGVDIFFVISGYLITSIILKELKTTDSLNFSSFYKRRIKRIFPAYLFVITIILLISFIALTRKYNLFTIESFFSSLFFFSNYFFYFKSIEYQSIENSKILLLHTWSLSVEEQFYILFPFIFYFLFKFKIDIKKIFLLIFFIGILIASYTSFYRPNFSFFSFHTRIFELIFGGLLSINYKYLNKYNSINSYLSNFITIAGLTIILLSILIFDEKTLHPSLLTLIPILGTGILIIFSSKKNFVREILSSKIFVGLGLISYSLYLWHYPLFIIVRYFNLTDGIFYRKIILIILLYVLSFYTYKFIEKPFRNIYSFKKTLLFLLILVIFCSSLSFISYKYSNLFLKEKIFEPQDTYQKVYFDDEIWMILKDTEGKRCFDRDEDFCRFNDKKKIDKNIILVGSSETASYSYNIQEQLDINHRFISMAAGSCLYIKDYYLYKKMPDGAKNYCNINFQKNVTEEINKNNNSYIIYGGTFSLDKTNFFYFLKDGWNENDWDRAQLIEDFKKNLYNLLENNRVILIYPYPYDPQTDISKIQINLILNSFSNKKFEFNNINIEDYNKIFREIKIIYDSIEHKNLFKIEPIKVLCPDVNIEKNNCPAIINNKILFSNNSHPSYFGSQLIVNEILKIINNN